MSAKLRGRPPKIGTLKNPPAYIRDRVRGRGGNQSEIWQIVLQDLNATVEKVEPYRKSLRIKFSEAAVLMNGACDGITENEILAVDARLPSMREMGRKGGKAKGESTPIWELVAAKIVDDYSDESMNRAAKLTFESWPKNDSPAPSKRTIRRYITKRRVELAK
ncbi:hypothetical protein [Limnohabitans sp. 2KL-51]|jgi:hypothetical protein|uniref:hypothetical protein n=1 Tax=Limnohabitans sp. 2KL-51 TaxID=1977911 RepID=UPI0011B27050|nr:hypothetical protein [Limnohabitans sp. 2KL-51]